MYNEGGETTISQLLVNLVKNQERYAHKVSFTDQCGFVRVRSPLEA